MGKIMASLLDLFCGAGGAAMGYHRAGFDRIVGVDNRPQKNYPFEFVQADALEYLAEHGSEFDAVAASPPCQRYSHCTPKRFRDNHPDLIDPLRDLLLKVGKPYVIENVSGARHKLINPVKLCGSMFGLKSFRHRFFEVWPLYILAPDCVHNFRPLLVTSAGSNSRAIRDRPHKSVANAVDAYGIDWMTCDELKQTFPIAFTHFIGERLIDYLRKAKIA